MYRCMGIHFVPVPSQGSERSCIGAWVSILYLYQVREVSGHEIGVWVSILYLYQAREVSGHA